MPTRVRDAIAIILGLATCAGAVQSQSPRVTPRGPFFAGAVMAGAHSFSNAMETSPVAGGYAYVAFPRLLVGAQGGTVGDIASRGGYGLATIGYPSRALDGRRLYSFVALGGGRLRTPTEPSKAGIIVGGGLGFDRMARGGHRGAITGMRAGYLRRAGAAGEPALWIALSVGAGGRRTHHEPPPAVIASRD